MPKVPSSNLLLQLGAAQPGAGDGNGEPPRGAGPGEEEVHHGRDQAAQRGARQR